MCRPRWLLTIRCVGLSVCREILGHWLVARIDERILARNRGSRLNRR